MTIISPNVKENPQVNKQKAALPSTTLYGHTASNQARLEKISVKMSRRKPDHKHMKISYVKPENKQYPKCIEVVQLTLNQ